MGYCTRIASSKADALTTGNDLTFDYPGSGTITVPAGSDGALRLCISVGTASIVYIRHNSVNLALNSGIALTADCLYTVTLELPAGETFSLRIGTNCTINVVTIDYVVGSVI